jgi:hypothetical protein
LGKRLTEDEFIRQAKEVHGNKYMYDKVHYVMAKEKVTITCKIHGDFIQSPTKHLTGQGCRVCGRTGQHRKNSDTTDSFIAKARKVHGDKYSYANVNYISSTTNITITCPIHGDFNQSPNNHKCGKGCSVCAAEYRGINSRSTEGDFILRAKSVHGEKYSYGKVEYVTSKHRVIITCPTHGDFSQEPRHHLSGSGCEKCGKQSLAEIFAFTTDEFIARAKEIHGDNYNYDKVDYINSQHKVAIICKEHGPFEQVANSHLQGSGCPSCGAYGFKPELPAYLYVLSVEGPIGGFTGYGITGDLTKRLKVHKCNLEALGFRIYEEYSALMSGTSAAEIESRISKNFKRFPQKVKAFRREATNALFIDVKRFVEEAIASKENNEG